MTFYRPWQLEGVPGRSDVVDDVMQEWTHRYCSSSQVTIFISTFNVNGKAAPRSIPYWLIHDGKSADLYVIGLQEMDLSTQAFFYDVSSREEDWTHAIRDSLPPFAQYSLVVRVRLVGIMLMIFKRIGSPLEIAPNSIHCARLPTGVQLINRMGNKGGVAISLRLNDTFLCFVNAHLAAGSDELDKRNQDYREISHIRFEASEKSLFDHDVIFWLGDLNYRLDTDNTISNEEIRELCSDESTYRSLVIFDTLKQQQKLGLAFTQFNEPDELRFRPSYKYDPGTSNWDSSDKMRCPAWCDRILWWCVSGDGVTQFFYDSVDKVSLSDHKPVRSLFNVTIRRIDQTRIRAVYEDAIREADKRVNESLPQISLSDPEISFGNVYFFESSVRTITIKNIGKSRVSFSFIQRPNEPNICAPWLSVTPLTSYLRVGEACPLSLQVLVDKKTAWSLEADGTLTDILVLRLDHGRDYFLPISAIYNKSIFGSSFSDIAKSETQESKPSHGLVVPIGVYKLINHLRRGGLENIKFDDASRHSEFIALRKAIDTSTPENLYDVCKSPFNMYSALLRLLDSFKDPVIPFSLQNDCLHASCTVSECWALLKRFPSCNRDLLICYLRFIRDLISVNCDAATQLQVMADILFKSDQCDQQSLKKCERLEFLKTLINNWDNLETKITSAISPIGRSTVETDLIRF